MTSNPLLAEGVPDFSAIDASHVMPALDILLAAARADLDAIKHQTGTPTWDSTLGALEAATVPVGRAFGFVGFLHGVAHSDALDDAYNAATPGVVSLYASIPLDPDLWRVLKAYADTPEAKALTGPRARLLTKTLDEFRRKGADLGPADKARLAEIQGELAELTNKFASNVLRDTAAWHHDVADEATLAGLPPDTVKALRKAAEAAGVEGYRVTLQAPIVVAVMGHADDRALRKRVWRAYNRRAAEGDHDNTPLIGRILALRSEQATLLGYDDFSDFVLADRMARTGGRAWGFVQSLKTAARETFVHENRELAHMGAELGLHPMQPWDASYVAEKLRKSCYDLDEDALRPYFPLPRVLEGMFTLVNRLYGIRVEPTELPAWHEDVSTWQLVDADGGRVLGRFYVDLFPRPTKRAGAWMSPLDAGERGPDTHEPHLGAICGNLTPSSDGGPALLRHRDVETLFHEFGHLLHHLLSDVELRSLSGTNVAWDFVELPSQIMENWCWEREALDMFSGHFETGEPLPDTLFERMVAARTFRGANRLMRQLGFAVTDLALHRSYDPATDGPLLPWARRTMAPFQPIDPPDDYAMLASFSHLFSSPVGYAAGYYSYQWAEVLDADAFTRFQEEGIFDPEVGRAFREAVLSKGDSEEPDVLFERFLGRAPDPAAHLKRYGLQPAS